MVVPTPSKPELMTTRAPLVVPTPSKRREHSLGPTWLVAVLHSLGLARLVAVLHSLGLARLVAVLVLQLAPKSKLAAEPKDSRDKG